MTDERLAELRRLCEAATPGPWTAVPAMDFVTEHGPWSVSRYHPSASRDQLIATEIARCVLGPSRANAEFIAAARTALPELLDELERLRRERDEARAEAVVLHEALNFVVDRLEQLGNSYPAIREAAARARDALRSTPGAGAMMKRLQALKWVVEAARDVEWHDRRVQIGALPSTCLAAAIDQLREALSALRLWDALDAQEGQGGEQRRATLRDVIRASEGLGLYDEPRGGREVSGNA